MKSIALYQRYLIICILIQILTYIAYFAYIAAVRPDPTKSRRAEPT